MRYNFANYLCFRRILLFSDNVHIEWSGQEASAFKTKKNGRIFLTTHRVIFNSSSQSDEMQSFSFPFITLSEVSFFFTLNELARLICDFVVRSR